MIRGQNFFSKQITLAAGAQTEVFSGEFSTLMILAGSATTYTGDIGVKIGKMGFRTLPTGISFKPAGDFFGDFQFKNTGSVSHTFHALAALGDLRNYNLNVDDSNPIPVSAAGSPVAGAAISATISGVTKAVSENAKGVSILATVNPVYVKDTSDQIIAYQDTGDFMTYPISGVTLKLVGDGATSTVYVTEFQ